MKKNNYILISMLATLLLAIVCAVSAYLLPHIPWVWRASGILAIVSLGAYLWLDSAYFMEVFSKRTTQYGLNSIVMSIIAVALVVVVNLIATGYDLKKDVTKNKLHTLSEQSQKVLKGLTSPVKLKAFIAPQQMQEFDQIFDKYTYYNKKMLEKEYIDVDKDPFIVQKYNIKQPGTVIVESSTRTARVDNLFGPEDPKLEEKLTNAIIQVVKGDKKKIYFITGHKEHVIGDTGREGLSQMKEALEEGRYKTEELVLVNQAKIPADAEIVVDAGPRSDFLPQEVTMIDDYIKGGGKMLFMMEPDSPSALKPLLAKFGADWHVGKAVLETNRLQQLAGGHPIAPVVTNYNTENEITRDLRQLTIFPIATPIEKGTVPTGGKVDSLFSTSSRSFEVELKGDKVTLDEQKDRKGPISLSVAVSGKAEKPADAAKKPEDKSKPPPEDKPKEPEFRVVVVGDSDFATNGSRRLGVNADLFQNMLSWLAHEEDLISIRPRPTDTSEFEITEERSRIINLASIVFAPAVMFVAGVAVWINRRRK